MEMSAQIKALFLAWLIAPFIPLAVLAGLGCILRKFAHGRGADAPAGRAETHFGAGAVAPPKDASR